MYKLRLLALSGRGSLKVALTPLNRGQMKQFNCPNRRWLSILPSHIRKRRPSSLPFKRLSITVPSVEAAASKKVRGQVQEEVPLSLL
jgi:hypothetical protein